MLARQLHSLSRLQRLQVCEYFLAVSLRIDLAVHLPDRAGRIDHERVTRGQSHPVVFHDLSVLVDVVLEVVSFDGAQGCEVLGIEAEVHPFSLKLIKGQLSSLLIWQGESGGGTARGGRLWPVRGNRTNCRQDNHERKYRDRVHNTPLKLP